MNFYAFIPKLLNMSLTASVAIVFVLLLRLMLKKAPKVISYALWAVVLFRLLCPVSIESSFSLFGLMDAPTTESTALTTSIEYVPENIVHTEYPAVALPVPGISDAINNTLPSGQEQLVADPLEAPTTIATYVWLAGVLVMAAYSVVSYRRLRQKLLTASPLRDNIYLADEITSPFVMGLVRPKIYLPSDMEEREQAYIIRHEQHHIRRGDHIIKALAFLALSIHWFNPLVWVAFIYSNKDMEMSCDEAVVKKMGDGILADYTASLLSLATGKHIIAGMPLAFGEGDTKGRILNLANWKKHAFWVVLIAVILCVVTAVCLLTNPKRNPKELPTVEQTYLAISSKGEKFDVGLKGHSRDSVIDYWGEPDGMLSGFWGDIWKLNGLGEVIVYYDEDGNVEHIKANQAEEPQEHTVKWTYSPMMSATWHAAFHFNFDLANYSHIEASCDNGTLWNLRAQGQPRDKTMRFEQGEPLCWMPGVGDSLTDTAESAKVTFTVYDGGEIVAKGVLDIKRTGTENGQSFYEAYLADTQILALQQESGSLEAVVVIAGNGVVVAYPVRFDPDEVMQAIEAAADPTAPQELTANAAAYPTETLEFVFASGAGGWGTYLTLQPDGSFTGDYSDSGMDTCYECKFEGRFTDIQQISDYCWAMKLGDVTIEKEEGTTWTENGIHYIAAGPHGVSGGTDFLLYAPGTPVDLIPAECRNWWPDAYRWRNGEINMLNGWSLCNLNEGTAFFTCWLS